MPWSYLAPAHTLGERVADSVAPYARHGVYTSIAGCAASTCEGARDLWTLGRRLLGVAELLSLGGSLVLGALLLRCLRSTWRTHADAPNADTSVSLLLHSLAILGPAALVPLCLVAPPDESIVAALLAAAASTGHIATVVLAADGPLHMQPAVQAALLVVACGVSLLLSRLLEGDLHGGLHAAASPDAAARFVRRPELDAFLAGLPSALVLLGVGSASTACIGESAHDWREGWRVWAVAPRKHVWYALRVVPIGMRALLLLGILPSSVDVCERSDAPTADRCADDTVESIFVLLPPALCLAAIALAIGGLRSDDSLSRTGKWCTTAGPTLDLALTLCPSSTLSS